MPGKDHGPSIKKPKQHEGLRKKGMSKSRAAAISNANAAKRAVWARRHRTRPALHVNEAK